MESNMGAQRFQVLVKHMFILAAIAALVIAGCNPSPASPGGQSAAPRAAAPSRTIQGPTLTLTAVGPGSLTAIDSKDVKFPAGLQAQYDGMASQKFETGTEFVLVASGDLVRDYHANPAGVAGITFAGWSGDADCSDGRITLDRDLTCIATFTRGPAGGYPPMTPVFSHSPDEVKAGEPVRFSADAADADARGNGLNGKIVSYEWDFMGDGVIDYKGDWLSHGLADFTFDTPGLYVMRLRVTDEDGLMNEFATRFRVK